MDLSTTYLGLELRNPLVASASPLSNTIAGISQLADAGAGAVVLYSLFEEQLRRDAADGGPGRYTRLVERAVAAVAVPVIASLNGTTPGGWTDFAAELEQAGAAARPMRGSCDE